MYGNLPWNNRIEEDNSGYPDHDADGKGLTVWPVFKDSVQPPSSPPFGP